MWLSGSWGGIVGERTVCFAVAASLNLVLASRRAAAGDVDVH